MSTINLASKNATEQRVLDYLIANASDVLAEKINAGKKTLAGALKYAEEEARKLAHGESCVCVDDATVFGWIIHFFEEDHLTEKAERKTTVPKGVEIKKSALKKIVAARPKSEKAPKAKPEPQLTMFEALMRGRPC